MSRALSTKLRRQLFNPYRDEVIRALITLEHDDFPEPLRFVSGDPRELASLTSNGNVFQTFPFNFSILTESEGQPEAFLSIANVDDRIGSTVLELSSVNIKLTIQLVLTDTPDTIEYEATNLDLVEVQVDALQITGKIMVRGLATEPCPGRTLSPLVSPVFFRGKQV